MKKFFLISLIIFPLYASAPYSYTIGEIATEIEKGSFSELVLNAVREDYTFSWLEKYTYSPSLFGELYSEDLSYLLPFENILIGKERNGAVDVMDQESGVVLSFTSKDGKIFTLSLTYPREK